MKFKHTLFSLSDGTAPVIHLNNSLACTMQEDLLRFIKGVWSLMLSPLINFNSASDRLSGTPRDTHAPIQMRTEWGMWKDKQGSQKMARQSKRHVQEAICRFKKNRKKNGATPEEMERKTPALEYWRFFSDSSNIQPVSRRNNHSSLTLL